VRKENDTQSVTITIGVDHRQLLLDDILDVIQIPIVNIATPATIDQADHLIITTTIIIIAIAINIIIATDEEGM
jgi:hypothetical protein